MEPLYSNQRKGQWTSIRQNSALCKYDINIRFCLALQSMGIGGEQARILTSFLDLPEAHKWPRNFSALEKFLHPATTSVKDKSQEIATKEEISLTHTTDSNVPQTLLEEEIPRFRVEASFDMGWQVRSSGGKYGSSTGHGLLIGALSKKVLDSVVYNKKCAVCTKKCRCGSETHQRTTHKDCPENPKKKQLKEVTMESCSKTDRTSNGNMEVIQ
jgi:hypothetical protein